MGNRKVVGGVEYVWSILDNDWVTLEYWNWLETSRKTEAERVLAENRRLQAELRGVL